MLLDHLDSGLVGQGGGNVKGTHAFRTFEEVLICRVFFKYESDKFMTWPV
jgi:hypothetical protein